MGGETDSRAGTALDVVRIAVALLILIHGVTRVAIGGVP